MNGAAGWRDMDGKTDRSNAREHMSQSGSRTSFKPSGHFLGLSFETRTSPDSLGTTHRAFISYLGNPISSVPVFLIQNISVSFVFFVVK